MTARWEDTLSSGHPAAGLLPLFTLFLSVQKSSGGPGVENPRSTAVSGAAFGKSDAAAPPEGARCPRGWHPFQANSEQPVAALILLDHLIGNDSRCPTDQKGCAGREGQRGQKQCYKHRCLLHSAGPLLQAQRKARRASRVMSRRGWSPRPGPDLRLDRKRQPHRRRTACRHRGQSSQGQALPRSPSVALLPACQPCQNSTPAWALMPDRNGCFTSVISVTRSAASISSSFAFRPVKTTWVRGGFSARRNSSTSVRSR